MQYNTIQYNAVQYDAIQYSTIQYKTIQLSDHGTFIQCVVCNIKPIKYKHHLETTDNIDDTIDNIDESPNDPEAKMNLTLSELLFSPRSSNFFFALLLPTSAVRISLAIDIGWRGVTIGVTC